MDASFLYPLKNIRFYLQAVFQRKGDRERESERERVREIENKKAREREGERLHRYI